MRRRSVAAVGLAALAVAACATTSRPPEVLRVHEAPAMLDALAAARVRRCPGARTERLSTEASSVTFEVRTPPCSGHPQHHEVSRILFGQDNVWHLIYAARVQEMDTAQRSAWLTRLGAASIGMMPDR